MGTCFSCFSRYEDSDDESVTVRGLEIGSPQFPQTTLDLNMHNLRPITRHDGRELEVYPEIRTMPRTMNLADLGQLGEVAASAMAVDEQPGRLTPEVAPVNVDAKEEEPAPPKVDDVTVDASTSPTDVEDVIEETVAPGTAR
ncbi:predicted protein [Histoplasma capsulatum G186AR]|uniref:Uncharacterized protein n=1 Tax=Ajellomyces capsulatus (strain G186AR / H82 / ATCC MYA-2454 / RMSCC 2432) TaxID=447093 RepID=C0NYE3_AJECG|nr:uncharacterized protein HCBG_07937 [Histoplasma capsulatum G186AR]EEH03811.1 predicted protein [Histoplasma capsulatum G186AR]